jgi:hypothetical protein
MKFTLVTAGEFYMGSEESDFKKEQTDAFLEDEAEIKSKINVKFKPFRQFMEELNSDLYPTFCIFRYKLPIYLNLYMPA